MKELLRTYASQFAFEPVIVNEHLIRKNFKQIILCGMGGSHLPAGILKTIEPGIEIYVHRDYDLPPFSKAFLESSVLVASSHSGNTEEVISFYTKAKQLYDMPVVCIATGGQLIALAQANNDPYIILQHTDFVPRTALGLTTIALASLYKDKKLFYALQNLNLDVVALEDQAGELFTKFSNKIPVFYSSTLNLNLAYNWKIKFNETAKQAAFCNIFPEANHNELESYEYQTTSTSILPVLLRDSEDHPRVQKRFDLFEDILKEKNIAYVSLDISNTHPTQKAFNTIILGDFVTAMIAESRSIPAEDVPLIESFKKRLV